MALPSLLALAQVLPAAAWADLLRLNRDINFRADAGPAVMGWLAAGSIVEVDPRFVRKIDGKPDVEETLKHWLVTARPFDGGRRGYFYPVKIHWVKPGSDPRLKAGDAGLVALRYLSRRKGPGPGSDLKFVTTEQAEVLRAPAANAPVPQIAAAQAPVAEAARAEQVAPSAPADPSASPAAAPAPATSELAAAPRGRTRRVLTNCGITVDEFVDLLARAAEEQGIPAEEMLAIKRVESGGNCRAKHRTDLQIRDGLASVGPLQIQVSLRSTSLKRECNEFEKDQIANLTTREDLLRGPQCVNNPAIAAKVAVETYLEHERILKQRWITCEKPKGTFPGFPDLDRHPEFKRQILRSSYNGGPCWAAEAAGIASRINEQEGRQVYNIYSWPHIRAAMLLPVSRRRSDLAQINVRYVDQVGQRAREIALTLPLLLGPGRRQQLQTVEVEPADPKNPTIQTKALAAS